MPIEKKKSALYKSTRSHIFDVFFFFKYLITLSLSDLFIYECCSYYREVSVTVPSLMGIVSLFSFDSRSVAYVRPLVRRSHLTRPMHVIPFIVHQLTLFCMLVASMISLFFFCSELCWSYLSKS